MFKYGDKLRFIGGNAVFTVVEVPSQMLDSILVKGQNDSYFRVLKEDVELCYEEKQPFFSIKDGQIEAAAKFIVANNSYMYNKTVSYMIGQIKNDIKRQIEKIKAGKEAWYCGTAGYIITIFLEDEDYYVVEVLVDPSVSQDKEFVNVENML